MPGEPIAARSTSQPNVSLSLVATDRGATPRAEIRFGGGRRWELAGDGSAPSPVEALLAALAACQVITYRHWAARLGVDLERCEVHAEGDLDPRGFLGEPGAGGVGLQGVRLVVHLAGAAPAARYEELAERVDRHCPVHSSLLEAVPLERELRLSSVEPVSGH
jgi:uncharacterized OsmC-like protein